MYMAKFMDHLIDVLIRQRNPLGLTYTGSFPYKLLIRTVDAAVFCVLPLGKSSDSKSSNIAITPTVTASAVRFLLLCKERKAESNSFFFTVCSPPLPWERCPVSAAKS